MSQLWQFARLNARVAGLALRGRWMNFAHVGRGYDRVAPTYQTAWQQRLRPVTDEFLTRLQAVDPAPETIIDLGAGIGYVARTLASRYPEAQVIAVDVSAQMLERAAAEAPPNLHCELQDMLEFLKNHPEHKVDWIVSTWALGYSNYKRLFSLCSRALKPGGTLAFIVNYADTLRPVFQAFSKCMFAFPGSVQLAAWPRFPKSWSALEKALLSSGFEISHHQDGNHPVTPPPGELLPWLRQTGILAGFDAMLDLSGGSGNKAADLMEQELERGRHAIFHHYCMAVAQKRGAGNDQ